MCSTIAKEEWRASMYCVIECMKGASNDNIFELKIEHCSSSMTMIQQYQPKPALPKRSK